LSATAPTSSPNLKPDGAYFAAELDETLKFHAVLCPLGASGLAIAWPPSNRLNNLY
jgi:hypothetical protein